jgi:hypothetical protein
MKKVARSGIPGECLKDLICGPFCSWMGCHIEMQHTSTVVRHNEEYEQDSKADCRDHQEIDGYHCFEMIFKKCAPGLRRWFATAGHVFGDSSLRHFDAKFQQFPVDTRRAPGCVSSAHRPDQVLYLFCGIGSSRVSSPTLPCPIKPKSLPMPGKYGFRLDD